MNTSPCPGGQTIENAVALLLVVSHLLAPPNERVFRQVSHPERRVEIIRSRGAVAATSSTTSTTRRPQLRLGTPDLARRQRIADGDGLLLAGGVDDTDARRRFGA